MCVCTSSLNVPPHRPELISNMPSIPAHLLDSGPYARYSYLSLVKGGRDVVEEDEEASVWEWWRNVTYSAEETFLLISLVVEGKSDSPEMTIKVSELVYNTMPKET